MNDAHGRPTLGQLDLNLLRVFDVVHRERNVSRAATTLAVGQSAVSHAIARLRTQLGDPLFTPRGRGVAPTPLADRLAPAIRASLGGIEEALARLWEFDPARDLPRLVLAMPDELEPIVLPPVVGRLLATAPSLAFASVRLDRRRMKEELATGVVDLAVDVARPNDPELGSEPITEDAFCVVAAATRRRVTRDAYLAARHVAVSSRPRGPTLEDVLLAEQGMRRNVVHRCQRYDTAGRLVASSDLLLTLPRRHAELLRTSVGVRILALALPLPRAEVHLYWHRRREVDPALAWVRAELRKGLLTPGGRRPRR